MKKYIKIMTAAIAFTFFVPAIAADRFIIKYKLAETQEDVLSPYLDPKLIEKLSEEQLKKLSTAANSAVNYTTPKIQIVTTWLLSTGSHVIILSRYLDEVQTKQFITNVEQDSEVNYIEEDLIMHIA